MKLLFLCLLLQTTLCQAFEFVVRDSQTGAPLAADINVQSIDPDSLSDAQWLQIKLGHPVPDDVTPVKQQQLSSNQHHYRLQPNPYLQVLTLSATGYQTLQTHLSPHAHIPITQIMLDPEYRDKAMPEGCDGSQICGHVYDQSTAAALPDVTVTLSQGSWVLHTTTDHSGMFKFTQPIPKEHQSGLSLTVQQPGFQAQRWTQIDLHSPIHLILDLIPGSGEWQKSLKHPLTDVPTASIDRDWLASKLNQQATEPEQAQSRERSTGAVFLSPPNSIRVGFDGSGGYCCGGNCATSQVYSLETYVQRGLDNEWIASWDDDSLKAGTIPFRSYGAWHVLNEPYTGYDICAGPCCQAFEFTGFITAIDAAIATQGIMLDQNGAVARSEYSAQNNSWDDPNDGLNCTNADLSCGDGAVGSPATGWTCLADPLASGLGCFGHGRGMSQWGTQFRAQDGETFADIVDAYYNANNNPSGQRSQYASTPIRLDAISLPAPVINATETFGINYEVFHANDNTDPFGPILLGASLFDGNSYFSDPSNDSSTSLQQSGTVLLQREFQLSPDIIPAVYDLVTALYLDVDNDQQISSIDWLLQVNTLPAALEVLATDDLIFRDTFDSAPPK